MKFTPCSIARRSELERHLVVGADPHSLADPPRAVAEHRDFEAGPAERLVAHRHATISAAEPTMRAKRGTVSSIFSRAQNSMSASSPGGPYVRAFRPSSAVGNDCATSAAAIAASLRSPPSSSTNRPAQYASSSANAALEAGAEDRYLVAGCPCRLHDGVQVEQRAEQHGLAARRRGQDRRGPVRRREDQRPRARGLRELARRGADVEARHDHSLPLAAHDRLVAELGAERVCLLDLAAAEDPLVARRRAPARSTRSPGSRRRRSRRGPRPARRV